MRVVITRDREFKGKSINNTRRVERVLKLIVFLNEYRSIREIAKILSIHEKSVQRYLNLLIQLGFTVQRGHKKYTYYRITNTKEFFNME